jgi:3-hydroxyacyl-[acyl-carrier-protein] dehydratase
VNAMLPHAAPFRFVDRVLERDPPRRCVTEKLFSSGEPLLEGAAQVPSSLVIEALCQGAAFLSEGETPAQGRIVRVDEAEMMSEVRAGDAMKITAMMLESGAAGLKAEIRGEVEGKTVARLRVLIGL